MQNMNRNAADRDEPAFGNIACPIEPVVVSTNRRHRRDLFQLGENVRLADVAGVNYQIGAGERGERFRSEKTVRVGNDSDVILKRLSSQRLPPRNFTGACVPRKRRIKTSEARDLNCRILLKPGCRFATACF